jgi:CHASE3 domain sensor protein
MRILHWNNTAIEKHHGLAFAVALLSLAAVGTLSYRSTAGLIEAQGLVSHTQEVIDYLDELVAQASQAESAHRGYVLSGEALYLEYFRASSSRIDLIVADLRRLTTDNPRQRELLSGLEPVLREKLAYEVRSIETRRTGGSPVALKAFLGSRGYVLMNRIQDLTGRMKVVERTLLRQRTDLARREADRSTGWLFAGSLVSFAVLLVVYYRMVHEIRSRKRSEDRLVLSNRLYSVLRK